MAKPLSMDAITKMLADDANKPKRGGGTKVDPTLDRTIPNWYKLNHHMCLSDCPHRQEEGNTTHKACWNPKCKDTRPQTDRGTNIVVNVHDVYMCRYCFLSGWKLP
jgi:hypothetical protein